MQSKPLKIGMNLGSVADSTGDQSIADLVRSCRGFRDPGEFNYDGQTYPAMTFDEDGWPTRDFGAVFGTDQDYSGWLGLRFRGRAGIFGQGNFFTATDKNGQPVTTDGSASSSAYDPATNMTSVILKVNNPGSPLTMKFFNTRRSPSDTQPTGLTEIEFMRPIQPGSTTHEAFGTFWTTRYVQKIAETFDIVRYMDFLSTNVGPTTCPGPRFEWADRTRPTEPVQALVRGAALEHAIAFSNMTRTAAWLCVFDNASEDYQTKFAQACLYGTNGDLPYTGPHGSAVTTDNPRPQPAGGPEWAGLDPDLEIYAEHGNEQWNYAPGFSAPGRNQAAANAEPPDSPIFFDGAAPSNRRMQVLRIVQMSNIFRKVFGDAAMGNRLKIILGAQYTADFDLNNSLAPLLTFLSAYWNNAKYVATPRPPSYYVYGVAMAAYRGCVVNGATPGQTADEVYASGLEPIVFKGYSNYITSFGLHPVIYEGSFSTADAMVSNQSLAINADPRAEAFSRKTITDVADADFNPFCYFNFSTGNWAAVKTLWTADTDPKFVSLKKLSIKQGNTYMSQPSTPDIQASQSYPQGAQNQAAGNILLSESFNFPATGIMEIAVVGWQDVSGDTLKFMVDGQQVATKALPWRNHDPVAYARVRVQFPVTAGVHLISIQCIQDLGIVYQSNIDLRWNPPIDSGAVIFDTDFSEFADGSRLEDAGGGTLFGRSGGPHWFTIQHASNGTAVFADPGGAGEGIGYNYLPAIPTANYAIDILFKIGESNALVRTISRSSSGSQDGYYMGVTFGQLDLTGPNGGLPNFGTGVGLTQDALVHLRVECRGNEIRGIVNGFEIGGGTDSARSAAGQPGFLMATNASSPSRNTVRRFTITSLDAVSAAVPIVTGVTIDPATVSVQGGATRHFAVTVSGTNLTDTTADLDVTEPGGGLVNANGDYTAPAAKNSAQTFHLVAKANADPTRSATAIITVPALAIVPPPGDGGDGGNPNPTPVADPTTTAVFASGLADLGAAAEILNAINSIAGGQPTARTVALIRALLPRAVAPEADSSATSEPTPAVPISSRTQRTLASALADVKAAREIVAAINSGGATMPSNRALRIARLVLR